MTRLLSLMVLGVAACSSGQPPLPSALGPSPGAPAVAVVEPTVTYEPEAILPPPPPVMAEPLGEPRLRVQTAEPPLGIERFGGTPVSPPLPDVDRATRVPRATDMPTATGEFR